MSAGTFTNVQTTGTYIDWYQFPFFFNDPTGVGSQVFGAGTNFLNWGIPIAPSPPSSVLFTGVNYGPEVPVPVGNDVETPEFLVGSLTYFNGTIQALSGAYGGRLTVSLDDDNAVIDPAVVDYLNIDTVNHADARAIPAFLLALDADFGNFANLGELLSADGLFVPGLGVYALVAEQAPPVTFNVFGKIVGDPFAVVTRIELDPQFDDFGAIIGEDPYLRAGATAIPEPGSAALVLLGLAAALLRRRIRSS